MRRDRGNTEAAAGASSRALTAVRSHHNRRFLGVAAVVGAGAMIMAACGSSGPTSSGGATTIPGQQSATTVKGGGTPAASIKGLYGSLPPAGTATKGGTVTVGQLTGATPTYIFPITPSASSSVYNAYPFQNNLFLPVYSGPTGSVPKINQTLSLAPAPTYSDGGKTVTIKIKSGHKWSNGQPVDANDVLFYIDLVKQAVKESAANWGNYTPGLFPDNVKSATASGDTLVMHLDKSYNTGFFTNNQLDLISAIPSTSWNIDSTGGAHLNWKVPANAKKVVTYLQKQGAVLSGFTSSPLWKVVDGPWKLSSFTPSTGAYTLVPNPSYTGPKPYLSAIKTETFTGITPQLNALKSGSLDVGSIDASQLGQVNSLRSTGYSVYGLPDFGFLAAFLNFKDATNHFGKVVSQLYVRQAMAHLQDQSAYVSGILKNAGVPAYGPVPSSPTSPFAPANASTTPYPFSVSAASKLLSSHGWNVKPGGTTTCQKPGTSSTECGAGIPSGTPLSFNWFYENEQPYAGLESQAFASEAAKVGMKIQLTGKTFNFLYSTYDNVTQPKNVNKWAVNFFGGFTSSFYPTTESIFNTPGSYNQGSYSSPTADKLIHNSVYGANSSAVTSEASYLTSNVPALFAPNNDLIFGVSKKVGGTPDSFAALTQYWGYYQYWYLNK